MEVWKKLAITPIVFSLVIFLGACSEFILEPRITFEISLNRQRLDQDELVSLTLHSFNLEVSSLQVELLKVGEKDITDFSMNKEERFNQIVLEFPLPDSTVSNETILVGVGRSFYKTGYTVFELP